MYGLTLSPPNYSIWIFTHLKLCLATAIHNFKWVKINQIWQNGGQLFSNFAGWCHILSLTYLRCGTECANKKMKTRIYATPVVKGLNNTCMMACRLLHYAHYIMSHHQHVRLTLEALKYVCITRQTKRFFSIWNHNNMS